MTAFLKIDRCKACHQEIPWEWVPQILLAGKPLAGTGVWRSRLIDALCPACIQALETARARERRSLAIRERLMRLLGGSKPYREFTFERYQATPGNELALQKASQFDPARANLYLWGRTGVGKTHLASAIARRCFERGDTVAIVKASQLTRRLRMKTPEEEQQGLDSFIQVGVLVLEDLGAGIETVYARQVLEEILDGRDSRDRGGLVVTSRYSLRGLVERLTDDTIPSRLAGMCQAVEAIGPDRRLGLRQTPHGLHAKKECA